MSEVTPNSIFVVGGPRKRGRPQIAACDRKVPLTAHVSPAYYDLIQKLAAENGEPSLSVFVSKLLADALCNFPTD